MPDLATDTPLAWTGAVRLDHLGVIRARGEDAASFLQGQLTNDVASLPADEARLAGFCSAKGRLQASFIVWRSGGDLLLACAADLLAPTLKRLSMFVLRARCRLSDASAEVPLIGLVGGPVPDDLPPWRTRSMAHGSAAGAEGRVAGDDPPSIIRLPDAAGHHRAVATGPVPFESLPALPLDAWRWLEVQSGVPTIQAATVDRFVPQMVNLELLGGVDFRKGCYPGQEVVARSQYRGTLKRRCFLFDTVAAAAAGQEVFHSAAPDQPAGMVVDAAPRPPHPTASGPVASSALVEVKLAALADGSLHLGSVDGPLLQQRDLPYPVPLDTADAAPA